MKKILVTIVLASVMLLAVSCSNAKETESKITNQDVSQESVQETEAVEDSEAEISKEWEVEDFYVYDNLGELHEIPKYSEIVLDSEVEEDTKYELRRGAGVGRPAKVVLADYDFTGFYCVLSRGSGLPTDEKKQYESEYFGLYPDVNEAVKHTSEIAKNNVYIYLSGYFYINAGELVRAKLGNNGFPVENLKSYDTYMIVFKISNDEVKEIQIMHWKSE